MGRAFFSRKYHVCFFLIILFPLTIASQEILDKSQKQTDRANHFIDSLRIDRQLPGMSATVLVKGDIVWSYGSGYADITQQKPVGPNTIFRIASVSKLITTSAMLKMVETGIIDLNIPINQYIDFPNSNKITLKHLASHTSGIRHYFYDEREDRYPHYESVSDALDIFRSDSLEFEPGSEYGYSSYGINLIGAVIEKQARQSFEVYVEENILKPLAMENTFLRIEEVPEEAIATFYRNATSVTPEVDLSYNIPGGGMYSTTNDLVRFGSAFLGNEFLGDELKRKTFSRTALSNGEKIDYGLGWLIETLDDGSEVYFHDGHMDGTHSILIVYPEYELSLAMISNRGSNWGIDEAVELACIFNAAEACPQVVPDPVLNPNRIRSTFQNLTESFSQWQNAVRDKDVEALSLLVSDTFSSTGWPQKSQFVDFLSNIGNEFSVFNQDISLRGLEIGDFAYTRTIRFENFESHKEWYLVFTLKEEGWKVTSFEAFK